MCLHYEIFTKTEQGTSAWEERVHSMWHIHIEISECKNLINFQTSLSKTNNTTTNVHIWVPGKLLR